MTLLRFWQAHASELWAMIERHVVLVVLSSGAAIALGVPIGILAAHRPRIGKPLVAFANVAQTVPSLALLGFLLPLPFIGGIGSRVAILALILGQEWLQQFFVIGTIALWVSVITAVASGMDYYRRFNHVLTSGGQRAAAEEKPAAADTARRFKQVRL